MTLAALADPIFLLPFLNGLLLAIVLPAVGAYARLRGEWLASLGIGQVAAAGVVLAAFLGLPAAAGALLVAVLAAPAKTLLGRHDGDDTYAVMLLAGWSVALLLAANTAHGEDLSRALLQGQIYFTGRSHLIEIAVVALAVAALLPVVSSRLLLGRFFPEHFQANGVANPRHEVLFDVMVAATLAVAATVVGVFGAFALVFVPPWVAFRFAGGWRGTVIWSAGLGAGAYLVSFALAIALDQPYGPVLVATLLIIATARGLGRA
ncbi:MAG: metal ABC transporter permease [Acidobacteria bacterium]|nr:metal ABC transporter permease [Acidobacteriota bacterium]